MSFYTPAQQAEAENFLEICYGLRSPAEATRLRALQAFVRLLPRQIVAGNAFVEAVGTLKEMPGAGRLREAVQDAVDFLTLGVHPSNTFLLHQMTQIAYFFNLLAKALQQGEEAEENCFRFDYFRSVYARTLEFKNEELLRLSEEIKASRELVKIAASCDEDFAKLEAENESLRTMLSQTLDNLEKSLRIPLDQRERGVVRSKNEEIKRLQVQLYTKHEAYNEVSDKVDLL
ncbi:hypothetical protein L596_009984 [Steinernema carpocapsae]|uniref:Uncharacterized protein n=1 Tax=Steinernema carpocapsae TaxID=34508 RepID=A0A4U5PI93_STECR|nr:hypothetical protein L596_009984 [Steinernema carpocapsae]